MDWYGILRAARRVAVDGQITSDVLAEATKTETRVASAWLGKFVRWGYVLRVGRKNGTGRGRPTTIYQLTGWGLRFRPGVQTAAEPRQLRAVANPKKKFKNEGD